jgi:hypothetical protein
VGTSSHSNAREVVPLYDLPLDRPLIVVLGNEGYGVRKNILNRCETLVTITSRQHAAAVSPLSSSSSGGEAGVGSGFGGGSVGDDTDAGPDVAVSARGASVVNSTLQESTYLDYVDSLNVSVCGGIILHHILLNSK